MRNLDSLNPLAVSVYFIAVAFMGMFSSNPIIIILFFVGALLLYITSDYCKEKKVHIFAFILILGCGLINPIFSHNGKTIIFVFNNNLVTFEAFIYGLFMGLMIAAALYWFAIFSAIMTSDKVIYTVGRASPKLALTLSISLRFIPLFIKKSKEVNLSQKAMGLYKDDTIISKIKGLSHVFSIMVTYIVEKTIITADSMAARGYGGEKRSSFSLFKFKLCDIIFIFVVVIFSTIMIISTATGALDYSFYPELKIPNNDLPTIFGYISYGILCLSSTAIEGGEKLKWHFLKSKIYPSPIQTQVK